MMALPLLPWLWRVGVVDGKDRAEGPEVVCVLTFATSAGAQVLRHDPVKLMGVTIKFLCAVKNTEHRVELCALYFLHQHIAMQSITLIDIACRSPVPGAAGLEQEPYHR